MAVKKRAYGSQHVCCACYVLANVLHGMRAPYTLPPPAPHLPLLFGCALGRHHDRLWP